MGSARNRKGKSSNKAAAKAATVNDKKPDTSTSTTADVEEKPAEKPERTGNLALFICLFAICRFIQRYIASGELIFSTTDDQPLVKIVPSFFDDDEFAALANCAVDHPLIATTELDGRSFGKTRGLVVKFNNEGEERFRANEDLGCLLPFFEAQRLSDANAFVMNILICDPEEEASVQGQGQPRVEGSGGGDDEDEFHEDGGEESDAGGSEEAVGWHVDQTVGIWSTNTYMAHQVDVWYASIPDDMSGGELELYDFNLGYPNNVDPELIRQHHEIVAPVTNSLVSFRGDAFHRVHSYRSESGGARVSLVLEQYKLDSSAYWKTKTYTQSTKEHAGIYA